MTSDQWFEIARWIIFFAFWIVGAGVVLALVGVILGLFTPGKAADTLSDGGGFGRLIMRLIKIAFTQLMDPAVPAQQKFIALGMVLFLFGIGLLVISIIPAIGGWIQAAITGGTGVVVTETPTPTG